MLGKICRRVQEFEKHITEKLIDVAEEGSSPAFPLLKHSIPSNEALTAKQLKQRLSGGRLFTDERSAFTTNGATRRTPM